LPTGFACGLTKNDNRDVDLKSLRCKRRVRPAISDRKRHWNHGFASAFALRSSYQSDELRH